MQFLPAREAEIVANFKNGSLTDTQPIQDMLSDSHIFALPTPSNMDELILKAGKITLIRNPYHGMQSIVKGMGPFWKKLNSEHIDAMYANLCPTAENVISNLRTLEKSQHEGKIVIWLIRFLRSCSQSQLKKFLRLVTGAEVLMPTSNIQVQFVDNPGSLDHIRPQSETCFKILNLPRQYYSLTHLRDNFLCYMEKGSFAIMDTPSS